MAAEQVQQLTQLETIRLGCVPEHFCSPVFQAVQKGVFGQYGLKVEVVNCPGGTGEMVNMLNNDQLDVAIALTEGLVASLSNKDGLFRIIGTYVSSPLTWSIATSPSGRLGQSPREGLGPDAWEPLKNAKIGISRLGSGSHIIPFVLADRMGWLKNGTEPFTFTPLSNITGLVNGVKTGAVDAFLWERVMTKPYYDSGELHHLSNITPPWPAFLFAATQKALAHKKALSTMLEVITQMSVSFMDGREGASILYVAERFQLPEDDVRTWFSAVAYPQDSREVSAKVLQECISVLKKAGVISDKEAEIPFDRLVDTGVAALVDTP